VREPSTASVRDVDAAPMRPRDRNRFQGLHRFSPNPNNYNNLGNLLFARQSTQDASTDGVPAQFCHSLTQKRSNVSNASPYPISMRNSSARTRKGRSQSVGGGTSSLGSSWVLRRSNVRRNASAQREASREPEAISRCRSTRLRTRLLGMERRTVCAGSAITFIGTPLIGSATSHRCSTGGSDSPV